MVNNLISSLKENLCTGILGVRGSYPEAPEAKLTPVRRSLGWRVGSKYAGSNFLIPNSSAVAQIERKD